MNARLSTRRTLRFVAALCLVALMSSCAQTSVNKTQQGVVGGAALGTGLGAIVGSATGDTGTGMAVGAAAGALTGALLGNSLDQTDQKNRQMKEEIARQEDMIAENRRLIEELRRRGADVRQSKRGVVINLPDILFDFDRSDLTRAARATIADISEVLGGVKDRKIAVEGHTDAVGTMMYNKRLSTARARSVARELARNGVPQDALIVTGFGEGSPLATNNSESGRARNRRVEVIVEN